MPLMVSFFFDYCARPLGFYSKGSTWLDRLALEAQPRRSREH